MSPGEIARPALASRQELLERGYTICPRILGPEQMQLCRELTARIVVAQQTEEYRRRHVSIGSLFDMLVEPLAVELITFPRTFGALGALGFPEVHFQHGIVFNKPPRTPRTFWHQDGVWWNHPCSYEAQPLDLILIYYLVDTTPANGCLRVIPGSHRRRHALHDSLLASYTPDLRRMADGQTPAFQTFPDEVSVPVQAGDLVVTDARLLHAAHANESDADRTALSLWYLPEYPALPESVKARYTLEERRDGRLPYVPAHWPPDAQRRLRAVLPPRYEGREAPLPMDSKPGAELR